MRVFKADSPNFQGKSRCFESKEEIESHWSNGKEVLAPRTESLCKAEEAVRPRDPDGEMTGCSLTEYGVWAEG